MALWFVFGWGGGVAVRIVDYLGFAAFAGYAAACSVLAARSAHGSNRTAWDTMTFALATGAAGALILAFSELTLQRSVFPSPANFFYLALTVLICVAVAQFPTRHAGRSGARLLIDGLIVAVSLFLLLWVLVLDDAYRAYHRHWTALSLELLYPVLDLAVVVVAVMIVARAQVGNSSVMALLSGAVVLVALANAGFAYLDAADRYHAGNMTGVSWALSLACLGAAALLSRRPHPPELPMDRLPPSTELWMPYLPLLIAGTIGPAVVLTGLEQIGVPVLMVLIVVKQVFAAWQNRRLLAAAADQAMRDPLTGLPNRTLFNDRLAHAMMLRRRDDRPVAVVSLDLDDFKLVNDTLGHPTADTLLIRVAERISDCVQPGDTVARLGGDEFVLLLESGGSHSALVSEQIVEAFDKPFIVDGHELLMRPSVGVAVASPAERDLAPEELVNRADIAMYVAKRSRVSAVRTFTSDMTLLDPDAVALASGGRDRVAGSGAAQVRMLGELRNAIDQRSLDLLYQPKVELSTGRVVGVEALLRWPHPQLGVLRPAAFLPLVLGHGLMRPVTDIALDKALNDTARWRSMGLSIPIAVNLFAPFLRDPKLPDMLREALARHDLPADVLTAEVTEDLVLDEVDQVTDVLRRLRSTGIRTAIDDFGSGYSALSYLRDLPIDEVKLDRHFIASVTTDARAAVVVSAIIDLTHDLGITVVAEGIEDAETAAWLREHGCDVGQGYYLGRPIAATEVPQFALAHAGP